MEHGIAQAENLIAQSRWAEVIELFERNPEIVLRRDARGCSPRWLHLAACHDGADALVAHLLMAGADPNAVADDGSTPLGNAIHSGHRTGLDTVQNIKLLVSAGADLTLPDETGNPPLHAAIYQRRIDVVRYLIQMGADPGLMNAYGESARDLARDWSDPDVPASLKSS